MSAQSALKQPVGVVAFLTPCVVLAATFGTALRQLGVPVGGLSFTVGLYLVLDFLAFRFGRRQPRLESLRRSFSSAAVAATRAAAFTDDGMAKTQSQQVSDTAPVFEPGEQQTAAPAAPAAGLAAKPVIAAAAGAGAPTPGLRLSMFGKDIYVNGEAPFEFENDFFKGKMLFLVKCNPPDPKWAAHFEGSNSNRAFEMQIQGKLKLLPKGEVYMGGELDKRPKQGLVTQTISKVVMSFAKQMVKSLHYSFGERRPAADPLDVENPHVTFPLYRVMDWFVVTPEDEEAPALGGALSESAEEKAARRGGKSPDIVWSTDVTYTMAFQSGIVNFQEWAVTDVPGQGNLDLNTFLCKQPVSVVVYDFTAATPCASMHKARDKSYMFRCTISNDSPGKISRPAAEVTMARATVPAGGTVAGIENMQEGSVAPDVDESDDDGMALSAGSSRETEAHDLTIAGMFAYPSDEQADPDKSDKSEGGKTSSPSRHGRLESTGRLAAAMSAGGLSASRSSYYVPVPAGPVVDEKEDSGKGLVKSGAVLPLLMATDVDGVQPSSPPPPQITSSNSSCLEFLGEGHGGRVAVLRGAAIIAGIQVVKVGGGATTFRSDYLYEGDVIVLHHPESRKFVRIGRGWTLGWSSKASASKIHFVVTGIEPGRPLAHGRKFSLRSRRWPDWKVGVARQTSSKLGGRGLGCFNSGKRRNTTRLTLLSLVAKPWFDPDKEGVIPALEAEADAITISVRGPFEDAVSGEDDEDEEESDNVRSDADEGMSDFDHAEYDSDVDRTEVDRGLNSQSPLSGDGISTKAARAMQCYRDDFSSLRVSMPAWLELLHRERRQGQLAFLLAVHATAPPSPTPAATSPSPSSSTTTSAAATAAAASSSDSASPATKSSDAAVFDAVVGKPPADTATSAVAIKSVKVEAGVGAVGSRAEAVDGASGSPPRAKQALSPAWTCVRTGSELSGAVQAFRESVGGGVATGSWRMKPRPKAIGHMGMSDQSVRFLRHEISEMQRWEAFFRVGDGRASAPPTKPNPTLVSTGTFLSRDPNLLPLKPNQDNGTSPERIPSDRHGDAFSPPPVHPPRPDAGPRTLSDPTNTTGRVSPSSPDLGADSNAESTAIVRSLSSPSAPAEAGVPFEMGEHGKGMTLPYRLLCESVSCPGELDRHFLSGSSASDLGVTVATSTTPPILGSTVARCLWESHWREEWAVLFPSHVACYMPLAKKPAWVLPIRALHKASALPDERCPFPGLRCLRLETIGRAHYLCFTKRSARDAWLAEISRLSKGGIVDPPSVLELGQDPREMYVLKTTKWRMPPRLILNARRPGFDMSEGALQPAADQQRQQQPWKLSADALRFAYQVHADAGNQRLVPFLDLASTFRKVDLNSMDLKSDEALCFFGNLYHLLVRHMLLVLGPPSAKEWPSRYAEVSYEVGSDVFSLQELEHCVLRGRLPRPSVKDLPKRFAPLPPELDDHYAYKLGKADARMSLFLNNGSQSNPESVVLLSPEMLDEQLNRACQAFVDYTVKTDLKRRQILVHKVFQLYAKDLQPHATSTDMVRYGLRFAGKEVFHGLSALDVNYSQAHIRYHPYLLKCHERTMHLLDLTAPTDDASNPSRR